MNGTIAVGWPLAGVLVLLTAAAALTVRLGGVGGWRPVVTAAARAVVQLGVVSLLITAVLASGWLTAGFVVLMYAVAAFTSARRIAGGERRDGVAGRRFRWALRERRTRTTGTSDTRYGSVGHAGRERWTRGAGGLDTRYELVAAVAIGVGVAPVLGVLFGSRLVPVEPVVVVPVAGILIGGAMTATSLAGRRALDELRGRKGEYEAALALGLPDRDAALLITRPTAGQALVPALDQTRTVGLVTLPGAFVGVLLGGGDPVQAGATQLVVLIALLAIEAGAVLVTVELLARQP